ncbi:MAG: hypothetical protein B7C24_17095 [Bacteroidetes bacterium 4572_77]|nr:MAG: hypothetical protein B7C24_17095 [Bacteroidetes bacterium 4572_77]
MDQDKKIFDDRIKQFDKSDMYSILKDTPNHVIDAIKRYSNFKSKINTEDIDNIILCGMGGSAIAGGIVAEIFNSGYYQSKKIPFSVNRSFSLPNHVTEKTLIILSSYSGNTDETLACAEKAQAISNNIICISAGGKLTAMAEKNGYDLVTMPGGYQPRCAFYYPLTALLFVMQNTGLFNDAEIINKEIDGVAQRMQELINDNIEENKSYDIAKKLSEKNVVFYAEDGIQNALAQRIQQQLQENANHLTFRGAIPEINHNEINSWQFPISNPQSFMPCLFRDNDESKLSKQRFDAIEKLFAKKSIPTITYQLAKEKELIKDLYTKAYFWDWASFYLAIINGTDPIEIADIMELKHIFTSNVS